MMNENIKTTSKQVIVECWLCGKPFVVSIHRKDTAKYCSRSCKDLSQLGRTAWNKGLKKEQYTKKEVVLTNSCLNCGVPVKNKFCGHSCQKSYRNKQLKGKTYVELYGEEKALEIRGKTSKAISETAQRTHFTKVGAEKVGEIRRGKTWVELYGVEEATRMGNLTRESLAKFRATPEGIEVRKATSERGIRLALSGKEFVNTKKGYFDGIYFGSSLEEQFLQQWKRLVGSLKNVERNITKIIPKDEGFRKTIPDYLIRDNNGKEVALVEIKGDHLLRKFSVYEKAFALYTYGREQNLCVGYFTYSTLELFKKLQGNPEPIQLNSLLELTSTELRDYIVNWKVQRLSTEEKETNKVLKNISLAANVPNYALPLFGGRRDSPIPIERWGT